MSGTVGSPHNQSTFKYDMFSEEVLANPLPYYDVLRRDHPIYYSEKYDTYFLSRFADIHEFLNSNDGTFISSEGTVPPADLLIRHNEPGATREAPTDPHLAPLNFLASPVYDQIRQVHTKVYRPNSAKALESVMREVARERLDLLVPRGRFDLVQEYAGIVTAAVTCHLFGLPRSESKDVLDTVNEAMATVGKSDDDLKDVFDKLTGFIKPSVRRRRNEGADGSWPLVDGLINYRLGEKDVRLDSNGEAVEGQRPLTDQEIAEVLSQVFAGGTETVPKTVGHGLWELLKRPEQLAAVRQDLDVNVPLVVEEIFRFCSPAQGFFRTVHRPTSLLGKDLKVGQRVAWLPASAARDEAEYGNDAAEFKWDRDPRRLLAFGHGKSFCAGVHLARLEARVLVDEFLRRVPEFEVHEDRAVRPPSTFQWGWIKVPISVPVED